MRHKTSLWLDKDLYEWLKAWAVLNGKSTTHAINEAMASFVANIKSTENTILVDEIIRQASR